MVLGEKFVYIELHKTGCSHVREILTSMYNDVHLIGKHTTYKDITEELRIGFSEKLKIGNIRNPWDWYVSVWAYGCMNKGEVFNRIVYPKTFFSIRNLKFVIKHIYRNRRLTVPNQQEWQAVYADSMNPELFRRWLKMIFANVTLDIAEGYGKVKTTSIIGLLTYRYLFLYTYNGKEILSTADAYEELVAHDAGNNFIDIIIRNETLQTDLEKVLLTIGEDKKEARNYLQNFKGRTNSSERSKYQKYYDQETLDLVAEKERFIIKKYGYQYE